MPQNPFQLSPIIFFQLSPKGWTKDNKKKRKKQKKQKKIMQEISNLTTAMKMKKDAIVAMPLRQVEKVVVLQAHKNAVFPEPGRETVAPAVRADNR
jgi:hypothetical protein